MFISISITNYEQSGFCLIIFKIVNLYLLCQLLLQKKINFAISNAYYFNLLQLHYIII